jgi:hypothetical protein
VAVAALCERRFRRSQTAATNYFPARPYRPNQQQAAGHFLPRVRGRFSQAGNVRVSR